MRRKVGILLIAFILLISYIPPYQPKVSAAEKTQAVKKNITVPDPIITVNGQKWYATSGGTSSRRLHNAIAFLIR